MKQGFWNVLLVMAVSIFMTACSVLDPSADQSGPNGKTVQIMDYTLAGANGTAVISAMSGTSLTVTYSPGKQLNYANLYLSQGNGTGLVLASQAMNYSGGTYTYTFSHSSFTTGALIYICILKNDSGVEACVPQGTLGTTTSWGSFTYGSSTSSASSSKASSASSSSSKASSSTSSTGGLPALASVNAGMQMVFQITNLTGGKWANNQIYIFYSHCNDIINSNWDLRMVKTSE